MAIEKAIWQAPAIAAAGGSDQSWLAAPCPRETINLQEWLFMTKTMHDPQYLEFLRSRPCSFCGNPISEPHHAIRRLRGLNEAGMGQKGPDYLAIPICRKSHRQFHDGKFTISREEILEICVINLICHVQELMTPSLVQRINAGRKENPE